MIGRLPLLDEAVQRQEGHGPKPGHLPELSTVHVPIIYLWLVNCTAAGFYVPNLRMSVTDNGRQTKEPIS